MSCTLFVAACGGDDAGDASDDLASAQALASELGEVVPGEDLNAESAAAALPPAGITETEIEGLVCTALAEIVADIEVVGDPLPDAITAQFALKVLGSELGIANAPAIAAGADAAAAAGCPEDLATVLAAAEQDSLAVMLD